MHKSLLVLVVPALLLLDMQLALADDLKFNSISTLKIALGDAAVVRIDGVGEELGKGRRKLSDFVLYLDGHVVATGADKGLTNVEKNELGFTLVRTGDNKTAWVALLGSPTAFEKMVQVDVGIVGAPSVLATTSGAPVAATLIAVRPLGLTFGVIFTIVLAFVLVKYGSHSDLLRDNQPADFGGAGGPNNTVLRRTYSLAQSQMAWWFALVLGAYGFLFLITGDINTLTDQALILMGIGTGTALGAAAVESTKTDPALKKFQDLVQLIADQQVASAADEALVPLRARRDALASNFASKNFFNDILTDANGISLHRVQMLGWTIVIGLIFLVEVYRNLALPTFDATILALLGISAGSYIGFKVPEHPY